MKNILFSILFSLLFTISYAQEKRTQFVIETSFGNMKGELYNETPQHRDNFVKLVNEGWYNDSPFHRIIKNFMIQGGQNKDGRLDPGYKIPAEFKPKEFIHVKGALAAARMPDQANPKKESSGSQFYIVQGRLVDDAMLSKIEKQITQQIQAPKVFEFLDRPENASIKTKLIDLQKQRKYQEFNDYSNQIFELMKTEGIEMEEFHYSEEQKASYRTLGGTPHLDGAYTIFGRITDGFDVIDKLAQVPTKAGDAPVDKVSMRIRIIE